MNLGAWGWHAPNRAPSASGFWGRRATSQQAGNYVISETISQRRARLRGGRLGDDGSDSWDTITARKADEAPVVVQAKAQGVKVSKLAIGIGLLVAALVVAKKGKRS